jgi:hypothetical protein
MRIPDDEWEAWRANASTEGQTITAWVRARCGEGAGETGSATTTGTAPGAVPPPPPVTCSHPRGARQLLNGGLVRCGACGDLVK